LKPLILSELTPGELLDDKQAAEVLKTKPSTLSIWRTTGRYNLPYVKIGRLVRYRAGDLQEFIESRVHQHTGSAA
jgi:predicted DNA-binding transcriptional regulator AlpA